MRFPNSATEVETGDDSENKAGVRHRFIDQADKNQVLGKISDWKLIYRTPGRIAEIAIPFEFKDVQLP